MKTLDLIKSKSKQVNSASNISEPYWNKLKYLVKMYLKANEINEISAIRLSEITGLKSKLCFNMLVELNKEYFNKKNQST